MDGLRGGPLRDLPYALNVPLQAHVIVTPGGRYACR